MPNPNFYFSLIAFLISLGGGIYFLVWWVKGGRRHPLLFYWSYGLGALLLFKVPNILANGQFQFVQEDFYIFFFATLLAYFLAYFALIRGFAFFMDIRHGKLLMSFCAVWLAFAAVYFAAGFLVPQIGPVRAPEWFSHVIFYIPAELLLFYMFRRAVKQSGSSFAFSKSGIFSTGAAIILLFLTSMFYITAQTGHYPGAFWYLPVISSAKISVFQIAIGIFLFFGLRSFAKVYIEVSGAGKEK